MLAYVLRKLGRVRANSNAAVLAVLASVVAVGGAISPATAQLYSPGYEFLKAVDDRDGDVVRLDATAGTLEALVDAETLTSREPALGCDSSHATGMGRELFAAMRAGASTPETGGTTLPIDRSSVREGMTSDV